MTQRTTLAAYRRSIFAGFIAFILAFSACSGDSNEEQPSSSSSSDEIGGTSSSSSGSSSSEKPKCNGIEFDPAIQFCQEEELKDLCFMDGLKYYIGEGENCAMMIIQWNDDKSPDALAWGYRWKAEETKYGIDMIMDIAKADKRLTLLTYNSGGNYLGYAIGGFAYDLMSNNNIQLRINPDIPCEDKLGYIGGGDCGIFISPSDPNLNWRLRPASGFFETVNYDFDYWECSDHTAHWFSGWYNGYLAYYIWENNAWDYSNTGASGRELEHNTIDLWIADREFETFFTGVEPGILSALHYVNHP